jgi:hypothetical protein
MTPGRMERSYWVLLQAVAHVSEKTSSRQLVNRGTHP